MVWLVQQIWQMYRRFLRWRNGPTFLLPEGVTNNISSKLNKDWELLEQCCGKGHEMMRDPFMPDGNPLCEYWICPQCPLRVIIHRIPRLPRWQEIE